METKWDTSSTSSSEVYNARHEARKKDVRDKIIPTADVCDYFQNHPTQRLKEQGPARREICMNKRRWGIIYYIGIILLIIGAVLSVYFGLIEATLPLSTTNMLTIIGLVCIGIGIAAFFLGKRITTQLVEAFNEIDTDKNI